MILVLLWNDISGFLWEFKKFVVGLPVLEKQFYKLLDHILQYLLNNPHSASWERALWWYSSASSQSPFEVRVRLLHHLHGLIRLYLRILFYATGLEEENFCPTLHFVELPVYLRAIRSANIPATNPSAGTFGCIVHLPYVSALWFYCLWPFSKVDTPENQFLLYYQLSWFASSW